MRNDNQDTMSLTETTVDRTSEKPEGSDSPTILKYLHEAVLGKMSEGFALCREIRGEGGKLTDYVILELNPALEAMLNPGFNLVGRRLSETPFYSDGWLRRCDEVLLSGNSAGFDFHTPHTNRWHAIRINRVAPGIMSQFFFEITDRKIAEIRQIELFDELNHCVKNNLGIVSAILSMQAKDAGPEVKRELSKAVDRVQSLAEVHGLLYGRNADGKVDLARYFKGLCERLSQSFTTDSRVTIVAHCEPAEIGLDQATSLGIIVNELVTNAVKHAFPAACAGEIMVRFKAAAQGGFLTVSDDGGGLPADYDIASTGLGMKLVRSLIAQLGGSLTVHRAGGAMFEIALPNLKLD